MKKPIAFVAIMGASGLAGSIFSEFTTSIWIGVLMCVAWGLLMGAIWGRVFR